MSEVHVHTKEAGSESEEYYCMHCPVRSACKCIICFTHSTFHGSAQSIEYATQSKNFQMPNTSIKLYMCIYMYVY